MKYREFSNLGWKISEIGIGCWAIGSEWGEVSENDAKDALYTSLDNGIIYDEFAQKDMSINDIVIRFFSILFHEFVLLSLFCNF